MKKRKTTNNSTTYRPVGQTHAIIDARTKIVCFLIVSIAAYADSTLLGSVPGLILLLAGMLSFSLSPITFFIRLRLVIWFLLLIFVSSVFSTGGEVLFEIAGYHGTMEGLKTGAVLSAKLALVVWLSLLLVATTTLTEIADAFEAWGSALRKRAGFVIVVVNIALALGPLLVRAAQRIKAAQISRGADVDSSLSRQARFALSAALPLFALAFRMSDQLAIAMDSRSYDPSVHRTLFSEKSLRPTDWLLIAVTLCIIVIINMVR